MMEDWTDIIGEELESIEESLPADDWSVLQQKYAASRKKKRAAVFAWAGGLASVAAAIALILLLFRPDTAPMNDRLVADELPPVEVQTPDSTTVSPDSSKKMLAPVSVDVKDSDNDVLIADDSAEPETVVSPSEEEEVFEVVKDTTSVTEKLMADASDVWEDPGYVDFPADEPKRNRRKVSIGLSAMSAADPMSKFDASIPPLKEPGPVPPVDSTGTDIPEEAYPLMKSKGGYTDNYDHEAPVSVGLSARFFLTDRLALSTGLNYTRYSSVRDRYFHATHDHQKDRQNVHYLGIPLRLDWMIVNRKHFNLYLGAGGQVDKCIYAKAGGEKLHEKEFLFSVGGTLGLQVNIIPMVGLYFEPDFSYSLNEGSIKTFRSREPFMVTARAGLRFSF